MKCHVDPFRKLRRRPNIGPMREELIRFEGPYGWTARDGIASIFEADQGRQRGVYLWTVAPCAVEQVYYVGETGHSFSRRHAAHWREHKAGRYHVYEPEAFARGIKRELWPGMYERIEPTEEQLAARLPSLREPIEEMSRVYRFFLGRFDGDTRMRRRAEAAIAAALRDSGQDLQEPTITYPQCRHEGEEPFRLRVLSDVPIAGLPTELEA